MTTSFDKSKLKVLLLEGIHPSAERIFRDAGYQNIETVKTALTGGEMKAKLEGVHFLGIRSRPKSLLFSALGLASTWPASTFTLCMRVR